MKIYLTTKQYFSLLVLNKS